MILWLLLSCKSVVVDSAYDSCSTTPTYSEWAQGFFRGKCQSCHASTTPDRRGAPEDVTFDTYDDIIPWLDAIERTIFTTESMPPSGGITEEERILLAQWLDCPH